MVRVPAVRVTGMSVVVQVLLLPQPEEPLKAMVLTSVPSMLRVRVAVGKLVAWRSRRV
jgi:hypothetical protein